MFSFFNKTAPAPAPDEAPILLPEGWVTKPASLAPPPAPLAPPAAVAQTPAAITPSPLWAPAPEPAATPRQTWLERLRAGLRKTGSSIAAVFTGTLIDDQLYEELEEALLMADAGVRATEFLLADLKRRVKDAKATDPQAVRALLIDALSELLAPLQKGLVVG